MLLSQMPFARREGLPALNALGQPIQSPVFGLMTQKLTEDPLVLKLNAYNLWPTMPERNRTTVDGVPLLTDEFYDYVKARGAAISKLVMDPAFDKAIQGQAAAVARMQAQAAQAGPNQAAQIKTLTGEANKKVMEMVDTIASKVAAEKIYRARGRGYQGNQL